MFSISGSFSRHRPLFPSPGFPLAVAPGPGLRVLSVLALCAAMAGAQDFGSHTLPGDFAEAGAKVQGALNKDPGNPSQSLHYCEGPSVDSEGNVFFTEGTPNRILKLTPQGAGSVFASGTAGSNGTEFDPQGRLSVCQTGAVAVYDKAGTRAALAVTGTNLDFRNLNDLTIGSTGAMYFTNWDGNDVYYRAPDGNTTRMQGFKISNGIEWSEEKRQLFLSQDGPDSVYRYDVNLDGTLKNPTRFASVAEPDGMTLDERGDLFVASYNEGKVQVFDSTGKSLGAITVTGDANPAGNVSNCVFGGPDNKTLYITGDGGLYKLQMKVAGRKRPGATDLARGRYAPARAPKSGAEAFPAATFYTLSGRKLEARPASLRPAPSPLFR